MCGKYFLAVIVNFLLGSTISSQTIVAIYYTGNSGALQNSVTVRANGRKLASIIPNEVLIDTLAQNEHRLSFERTGFRGHQLDCSGLNNTYLIHIQLKMGGEAWSVNLVPTEEAHPAVVSAARDFRVQLDEFQSRETEVTTSNNGKTNSSNNFVFGGEIPTGHKKIASAIIADTELHHLCRPFQALFEAKIIQAGHLLVEREDLDRVVNEQKFSISGLTQSTIELGELEDVDCLLLVKFARLTENIFSVQASIVDVQTGLISCTWFGSGELELLLKFGF